jgi:hypothetical protein
VNDHETSVLTSRLHRLADDMAPPLDVVGQVRAARASHVRQRRGRIALIAVATATAAVVVGTATAADLLSAAPDGQVAGPRRTTTERVEAPPADPGRDLLENAEEAARRAAEAASTLPAGWETRRFEGVRFGVPPGARSADVVSDVPVSSWTDGPSFIWNGPHLGGDAYSSVNVTITEPFEGGLPPREGGHWFTVPGAEKAYGNIESAPAADGLHEADRTIVWLEMLAGDRVVHLDAVFAAGPDGEQTAHHLVASVVVG